MTDDKKLVDAYASIYEHHQKDADGNVIPHEEDKKEQIDEALPALAMPLLKFAGKKLLQFGANKLKQKAMSAVGNMMGRGGGPSTQAHRQNQMGMQAAHYEPEMAMVEGAATRGQSYSKKHGMMGPNNADKRLPSGPFAGGAKDRSQARNERKFGKKDGGDVPDKKGSHQYNPMASFLKKIILRSFQKKEEKNMKQREVSKLRV